AQALLCLDNGEEAAEPAAAAAAAWLGAAAELRVLATSREPLGIEGEMRLDLGALPVADACDLFVARAAGAGAALPEASRPTVLALVDVLDGLPLAIELAAAYAPLMNLDELLARLRGGLGWLESAARAAPARQAALAAA